MQPSIQALRAITGTFFRRILFTMTIVAGVVTVIIWALILYLGQAVHPLWYIFFIVVAPLTIVAGVIAWGLWMLSGKLLPRRVSRKERKQIVEFTDKVLGIAALRTLSWPVLVAIIAKDIVKNRGSNYIEKLIKNSQELRDEFTAIRTMFE